MSLEAALAENTAALGIVADLLRQSAAGRDAAVATLSGITSGATPSSSAPVSVGADAAPAAEAPKTRGRPAGSKNKQKDEAAAPVAPAVPTVEDLRAAAGGYMQTTDAAERERRKEFTGAILAHFGVAKVVEVPEDQRAQVIAWYEAKGRGETVNFNGAEDEQPQAEEDDLLG